MSALVLPHHPLPMLFLHHPRQFQQTHPQEGNLQAVSQQRVVVKQWIAAFLVGAISLLAFIVLGHTPVIRALGMAASISGVTLILQRFGLMFAVIGGLALSLALMG